MTEATETEPDRKFKEHYQIDKILELRDAMYKEAKFYHLNTCPEGDKFDELVDALCYPLPSSVIRETVYDSVQELAGEKLTARKLWDTSFRLAANLPRLRRNTPVPMWTMQRDIEWVPVQAVKAKRAKSKGRAAKKGFNFTFQILAGTACPLRTNKFWTDGFCWKLVREEVGFVKRTRPPKSGNPVERMFSSPRELVGLRLMALLHPDESTTAQPGFDKIDITPSLLKYNHEVMDKRDRLKPGYDCPKGFGLEVECHRCYAGYTTCPAGTHRLDYQFDYCHGCGHGEMPFDYEQSQDVCLTCFERRQLERKD